MYKKRIWIIGLLSFVLLIVGFGQKVGAQEMNFSWEVKQSESQRDKTKTYFDLRVQPGQQEVLEVVLKNTTDEPVTVNVETNTAVTNNNGVIDYGIKDPELDKTLKYPFSTLAKTEPEVKLGPKEEKTIQIKVDIPKEPFEGIILGGIRLSQKEDGTEKKEEAGVQIENKFAVVIGVRLSENDQEVKPEMQLLGVKPGQRNYRNVILAQLQNPQPRILSKIKAEANVYAAANLDKPVYHSKQENLQMAPNSNFQYAITMNNKAFKPGKYVLRMTTEATDQKWEFEKEFEIKDEEAKKFNEEAVELAEEPTDYTLYYILGAILIVLIIILVIVWRLQVKKNKQKLERGKRKRKGKKELDRTINGKKHPKSAKKKEK